LSDRHEPSLRSLLTEAGKALGAARSLSDVIEALRSTARSAIGAEGIAVVLKDDDQCYYVAEDAVAPLWSGSRFPANSCVSGWAMRHREMVVIPDIRLDPRVPQDAYRETFVRSLIMAPIGHPEPVAALGAYWSEPRPYDADAVETLQLLAQLAATAIENARLIHAMEESERLRTLMLDAGRMGTWSFNAETRRLDTSETFRRTFGRDPAAPFTFADFVEAMRPDDRNGVVAAIDASLVTGSDYQIEYRIDTPAGEQRWIEARGRPALLLDGGVNGLVGVTIDITDRKQAEDTLKTSAAMLEHLVEERTRELIRTQDALKQSQKLEAMGQLTGGVAHDFNNLLTPIVGSLDMLHRRKIGGEREQRLIAGALESADRARTLVQRLLAFARRQPLKPEAIDISALILGMTELVGTTLGPMVAVDLKLDADLPLATVDAHQIEMALLNFAANARDAMPSGGSLTLSTDHATVAEAVTAGLAPGRYVVIRVVDTGTGMDDMTRERAIEPFFSTKGVGRGTGLGLSMAHGLALQLGGAMTIESAIGVGTTVELWLPASADAVIPAAAPVVDPPSVAGTALLVDDEDLVRASTADMLTDLGFEVVEARSGAEALASMTNDRRFDIVISDHVMPNMTGVELAREIRRLHPGMPLLIVSGYSDTAGLAAGLPRLEKPFRQADLAVALAGLLVPRPAVAVPEHRTAAAA
jgi:PAS domain S-box-containing protein